MYFFTYIVNYVIIQIFHHVITYSFLFLFLSLFNLCMILSNFLNVFLVYSCFHLFVPFLIYAVIICIRCFIDSYIQLWVFFFLNVIIYFFTYLCISSPFSIFNLKFIHLYFVYFFLSSYSPILKNIYVFIHTYINFNSFFYSIIF